MTVPLKRIAAVYHDIANQTRKFLSFLREYDITN